MRLMREQNVIRSQRGLKSRRRAFTGQVAPLLEQLEDRCLLSSASAAAAYGQLPLAFQPNEGQAPAGIGFSAQGQGYQLVLSPTGVILGLQAPSTSGTGSGVSTVLSLSLVGGNPAAAPQALDQLPGVTNYLIGNDPRQWHPNIPNYAEAQYSAVYPGVDLRYYGNQGQLEYDFVVNPGSSPGVIRLAVNGAQSLSLDAQGNLVIHSAGGDVLEKAPVVYQLVNGVQRPVAGRFVLQNTKQLGFAVGAYDASLPLVIDPVLAYSTYLGGSPTPLPDNGWALDWANEIAVDSSGDAYVSGFAGSSDFPTTAGAFQGTNSEGEAAFVSKLNATGTALIYSTYVAGITPLTNSGALAIAVNAAGDAYIVGDTDDPTFPVTLNALQPVPPSGGPTNFITELNASGTGLLYSTFFDAGSTSYVALDAAGDIFVAGNDPVNTTAGALLPSPQQGGQNPYVAKLNPSGTKLLYATYVPCPNSPPFPAIQDVGGLAVDAAGDAYVAGDCAGGFVDKINPTGTTLIYSADWNLVQIDHPKAIAVNSAGDVYVTGNVSFLPEAANLPPLYVGIEIGIEELNASGTALLYGTTLGGANIVGNFPKLNVGGTSVYALAINSSGDAFIVGATSASDYPVTSGALQGYTQTAGTQAFLTEVDPLGRIGYSTLLGGAYWDYAQAVAVDAAGDVYLDGLTGSPNFPTTAGVLQPMNKDPEDLIPGTPRYQGGENSFVTKISFSGQPPPPGNWVGADVAGATDDSTRLLWTAPGTSAVWSVSSTGSVGSGSVYGPFSGWSARADATGSDGNTRILWTNTSGAAALWIVNASGVVQQTAVYGPFSGWSATDVAVGKDGNTRILWTNTNGAATVWDVYGPNLSVQAGPIFTAARGWTARKLTTGSDGLTRLLWTNTNGASAASTLFASGALDTVGLFGAMAGWTPVAIAVGSDDQLRILWDNTNGAVAIWDVNSSYAVTGAAVYGPFAGWVGSALAAEPDGTLRLLWDNSNGAVSLWDLTASGGFVSASVFGPIPL